MATGVAVAAPANLDGVTRGHRSTEARFAESDGVGCAYSAREMTAECNG